MIHIYNILGVMVRSVMYATRMWGKMTKIILHLQNFRHLCREQIVGNNWWSVKSCAKVFYVYVHKIFDKKIVFFRVYKDEMFNTKHAFKSHELDLGYEINVIKICLLMSFWWNIWPWHYIQRYINMYLWESIDFQTNWA